MITLKNYQRNINQGLDRAFKEAAIFPVDLESARLIIFSDHHRGKGDEADDFRLSKPSYQAALNHYLEMGHILIVLGDVEELWEDPPEPILECYTSILNMENRFHQRNRYWRFWGNHDDEWCHPDQVQKHLGRFFDNLRVHESIRLDFFESGTELGEILLVHGHQGTFFNDRFGWFTRIVIRYIWRPIQRLFKIRPNTPATDWRLRYKHDIAMYNWTADKEKLVLIVGHTHHPIFPSSSRGEILLDDYQKVNDLSVDQEEIFQTLADSEFSEVEEKPSYFNSGCCCFNDGSITGIEIKDGQIYLVRWPDQIGRQMPQILESADLREVFQQVAFRTTFMEIPEELK